MKTKNIRRIMCKEFGYDSWKELRPNIREAKHAYVIKVDWQCMALGRKKDGQRCAFAERIGRMPGISGRFVSEEFTYLRFQGDPTIWKYGNSTELKHQLKTFDNDGLFDDMEDGDEFILEPIGTARSGEYQKGRRAGIKDGTWEVKVRGPNPNGRRQPIHHFRPY